MKAVEKTETVYFSTKGRVVIPRRLRNEFEIEEGTRATVVATPEGILLKPITTVFIKRARGILKRKPDDKPFAVRRAQHKRAEKKLEEAKCRGSDARETC